LEESFDEDDLPLPAGAPPFIEAREAYAKCRWIGPGRGWIDPVQERQGAVMAMDSALSTLEDESAQQGMDFEETLEQRRYELQLFDEYGIPRPEWAGQQVVTAKPGEEQRNATAVSRPPRAPQARAPA
jgi:capsid protein